VAVALALGTAFMTARRSGSHHEQRTEPPEPCQPWLPTSRSASSRSAGPPAVPEHPQGEKVGLGDDEPQADSNFMGVSRAYQNDDQSAVEQRLPSFSSHAMSYLFRCRVLPHANAANYTSPKYPRMHDLTG